MAALEKDQLKIELKKWERFFLKINGRKPTRHDILASEDDVKDLYKKYWKLNKTSASHSSQSVHDVQCTPSTSKTAPKCLDQPSLDSKKTAPSPETKDNEDAEAGVWNACLLKIAKETKARRTNTVCEPYLKNLRKNYSNEKFVKKVIIKRKKKKKEEEPPPSNDQTDMIITEPEDAMIDPNSTIFSQLQILTQVITHPPEEESTHSPLPPTVPESSFIPHSFSTIPPIPIDQVTPTIIYSPNGELLEAAISPEDIQKADPIAVVTISIDVNNGQLDVQSDSGFVSNGSVLSTTSCEASINNVSQMEVDTAIEADLFAGDFDTDPLVLKVKECIGEKVDELEEEEAFEGCLLPLNYKRKRKPKVKSAKAIKKRNEENFIKIDLKKKSYASKGYKKINVQKLKRKAYYKSRRGKCFTCGEQGHWMDKCPLKQKPAVPTSKDGTSDQGNGEAGHSAENNQQKEQKDPFDFPDDEEGTLPLMTINYKH